jgi:bile acid:Na+ symporter, BASS family
MAMFVIILFLVTVMMSIGLELTIRECLSVLRNGRLLSSALVANFVVVPLLGLVIARILPMPRDIETGFLLLAAAPGALLAVNFTRQMRDSVPAAASLLLVLTVLSLAVTPPLAQLLLRIDEHVTMHYGQALRVLVLYMVLPLTAGLVINRLDHSRARILQKWSSVSADVLFILGVILTFSVKSAATKRIGVHGLLAMLLLVAVSMVVGWIMGGPNHGTRRVLAVNTSMRNVALCLAISSRSFSGTNVEVAVIAFSALMLPPNFLFTTYHGRKLKRKAELAQSSPSAKDAA